MRNVLTAALLLLTGFPALACGADSDCEIGARSYRIAMPEGHDGSSVVPAIVFAHGYKGSAAGVMRNGSLRGLASELGAALIAFNSKEGMWDLPNHPHYTQSDGSAEFAYVDAVLEDATRRFPIDAGRLMLTGFSSGGMLVWNLACARSGSFAGFAPVAGTFWLKPPETCSQPVASILHIHGDADTTVPLDGRVIADTRQGNVSEALAMYRGFGAFGASSPVAGGAGLDCEESTNAEGDFLGFCLFEGGHSLRTEHIRFAWERLRRAGRL